MNDKKEKLKKEIEQTMYKLMFNRDIKEATEEIAEMITKIVAKETERVKFLSWKEGQDVRNTNLEMMINSMEASGRKGHQNPVPKEYWYAFLRDSIINNKNGYGRPFNIKEFLIKKSKK